MEGRRLVRRRMVLIGGPTAAGRDPAAAPSVGVEPPTQERAGRRTLVLTVALVAVSVSVLATSELLDPPVLDVSLSWWVLAMIAALALVAEFDVEFRREAVTFTFSEVVLVLGLFLASPWALVIGRLVGEGAVLVGKERQPLRKTGLNLASSLAELTTLFVVHDLLGGGTDVTEPMDWAVALVAVACADLVGYAVIHRALRWHGAPITLRSLFRIAVITVPVNTSFALVIGILLVDRPVGALLLLGVGGFLVLSYRSYTSLRQRFESLSLLYDFTRLVSGAQRPDAVLEAMLAQAKDLLRAERAEIWLQDETMLRLSVDDHGRSAGEVPAMRADTIATWFRAHQGATIIGADPARSPGGGRAAEDAGRTLLEALAANDCIVAPITESGEVVGLVAVVNRLGGSNAFNDSDRTMFATLANHASVALENGRLIDRLHEEARLREHEALHDALTGLPNRVLLGDRLRDELVGVVDHGHTLAVGLMDLDGFKEVNDTLGHQSGDVVLGEVARRLAYAAETAALVARLGGDEFAILVDRTSDRMELESLARRIREELARPFDIDGVRINISASIGFAIAPDDASDAPTLLQRADVAMYSAKAGHGNGVAFYEAIRDENSPRRLALATDLRAAIADGQLSLVFQPKARLVDDEVVGFEALVRWRHPELGQVFPDEFIPIAERTGSIGDLTVWVLRTSVAQLAEWSSRGHRWSVAVNVAMRNLLDDDFSTIVDELLARHGCDPSQLILEITETSVMTDTARTLDVMRRLSELGVRLSIDDFGTGYSSLSYLQQLPVEELKIDKCFVRDMVTDAGAEAIVRSVLDLANNLDLRVVAEGVEDRPTWERLRQLGCQVAQGYYMSRPMPPDDIEHWYAAMRKEWPLQVAGQHLTSLGT